MKKKCDICGGSGQVGFFAGVSRFVISWEECDECNGTGEQTLKEDSSLEGASSEKDSKTDITQPPTRQSDSS